MIRDSVAFTFQWVACATLQWVLLAAFLRRLRRERAANLQDYAPAVAVIVPCKGEINADVEANLRSKLEQVYAGRRRYLFVTPSERDPAYAPLRKIAESANELDVRVLVSDARPRRCSEALLNYLHGVAAVGVESELLVGSDADLRADRDWIARLVAPLSDPRVTVSTSVLLFAPTGTSPWTLLRSLWMLLGLPLHSATPRVSGHAFALRRVDFVRLGVEERWRRAVTTDFALEHAVRAAGGRVAYAALAAPVAVETADASATLRMLNKWMLYCRLYMPLAWLSIGWILLVKLSIWAWAALVPEVRCSLVAATLNDSLYAAATALAASHFIRNWSEAIRRPWRPIWLWAALLWPATLLLYAVNWLQSAWMRDVVWGGYVYRLGGPYDVEVLKPDEQGDGPWRFALWAAVGTTAGFLAPHWARFAVLIPMAWLALGETPRRAFGWGWLFGICASLSDWPTFLKAFASLHHLPLVAQLPAYSLWCVWRGMPFAFFALGAHWLMRQPGKA